MKASASPILFVSNGMGEDSIAAEIIARLPSDFKAHAYPVIGEGRAFDGICPVVGPRSHIPSQGARLEKFSLVSDLPAMAGSVVPAIGFLRHARAEYRKIAVIGDSVGMFLAALAGIGIDLYLDVYKVGQAHRYSWLERMAIRRSAALTLCRDEIMAGQLRQDGINARSHGNIMLDTITHGDADLSMLGTNRPVVGLLPGSRATAPAAFALQAGALVVAATQERFDAVLALAADVDPADLARASGFKWERSLGDAGHHLGRLAGESVTVELIRGATGNVIEASDLLLSQSGTATQQALGLGKPIIAFRPQGHRNKRLADEQALMGEARRLIPPNAEALAAELVRLLRDRGERERLGQIGRDRLGRTGTMAVVLDELVRGS